MKERNKTVEIEQEQFPEIEYKTEHPGLDEEWSLYHVNYATGENTYLNTNKIK